MRAWKDALIASPVKRALPLLSFPCVSLLGVTVEELVQSAALQARGMALVADKVPASAAVGMMDLSVEAEAFGAAVRFQRGEVPTVTGALVRGMEAAQALRVPPVGAGRTGVYVQAVREAAAIIHDRPVLAGVIGPFSLAGRLMGVTDVMTDLYDEPEAVHEVLAKAADFVTRYALAFREAGANGVVIAEPLAGLLSPALAEEFSEPYVRQIARAVRDGGFLAVYHNCGNSAPRMIPSILRTGCDAFHFGDTADMPAVLAQMPPDALVLGNVSPSAQFAGGTPEGVRAATLDLLRSCAPGHPNYVVSSGCDIPPSAPWENILAFFGAVQEYYQAV
ncbi:MAG TPA: uroporphyrinogen decarboxylase family protein [Candidatus Limnocylindria bacterium]|nr:uroporphyrinogen decarboxylase family protein [Candidatus Limnocylindria bacterium]